MSPLVFLLLVVAQASAQAPPAVTAVEASPASPEEGAEVVLSATVENPSGRSLSYTWDPGDGTDPRTGADLGSIVHRFPDDGTFTVTVTVEDGSGGAAQGTGTVSVRNVVPEIDVLDAPEEAARDEPAELEGHARDPGSDDVLTYTWNFGDGETESGVDLRNVTHEFREAGLHSVILVVEDDDGGRVERSVLVAVERTAEFRLSGAVSGAIASGFDGRPGFMAISPESSEEIPEGFCSLTITVDGDEGDGIYLGGLVPSPIRPGTYPAIRGRDSRPGTFQVQDMLSCDRPDVDCSGGLWRGQSESGTVTLGEAGPERVVGRLEVGMSRGDDPYHLVGSFTAGASTIYGTEVASGEGTCFRSGILAVERMEPAPDAESVDFDSAQVRVTLSEPFDPSSLDDGTFRLEYRLPDAAGAAGVGTESYARVDGAIERTGDRSFRFVPEEPLLDGVFYRAVLEGGERGVRGRGAETMEDDRTWRFSTLVEPEVVRVAAFQAARNAPLVPGRTTLTRVYVEWEEKEEVHPDWQVVRFPARVEIEVDGGSVTAYPARDPVSVRRPDQFVAIDSVEARNSINFFGWEPSGPGGSSAIRAVVEPGGQERSPPRRYESAPLELDHHKASPRLTYEAQRLLVSSWEDGVPAALADLTEQIARQGAEFTRQNFPVVDVSGFVGDLPMREPFMLSRSQDGGLEVYADLFGTAKRDQVLARQAHDLIARDTDADLILLFMPSEVQEGPSGYTYDFPIRTVGVFVGGEIGPQTLQKKVGTVAHEFGHAFGLEHRSSCPRSEFQACLSRGKSGSDDIEGFRLDPDGSGGANKSKAEGNAEAPRTHAVLSLMHWDGIPAPALFVLNDQYAELLRHPRLSAAGGPAPPALAATLRAPMIGPSPDEARGGPDAGTGVVPPATHPVGLRPDEQASRWFLVSGLVSSTGQEVALDPVQVLEHRPPVPSGSGDLTVEIVDASGEILRSTTVGAAPVEPSHVRDADGALEEGAPTVDARWFWATAPYTPEAAAVVVKRGEGTLMRLARSPNPPGVEFMAAPSGGWPAGHVIAWRGSDPDGDPVGYALFYSPDGEGEWRGLVPPWTRATEIRVDPSWLPAGPRPTLRVVATDGFRQAEATMEMSPDRPSGEQPDPGRSPLPR